MSNMTATIRKIAEQVKALSKEELDEFLSWLARYELEEEKAWDEKLRRDARTGGKLDGLLTRVRQDIAEGRTRPLDEVLDHS